MEDNKKKFLCVRCNYKFKHDATSERILRCPFCGKTDKVQEDKPTQADELIEASEDSEQFYNKF